MGAGSAALRQGSEITLYMVPLRVREVAGIRCAHAAERTALRHIDAFPKHVLILGRDPRGQERTESTHHSMRLWAQRPTAANDLLPTVFPPHVTDGRGCLVSRPSVNSGSREVMVMRVFVAGGTGVIGRRLVPQLVARGHQVTATTTSPAKLGVLEQLGADAIVLDGLDAASVGEAVATARPDAIVHQMTAISPAHAGKPNFKHFDPWFAPTSRLRTEGTDHLLAAAEATRGS